MKWLPRSLFSRTAVLIASTLLVFSLIAWQTIIFTALVPAADLAVQVLTRRASLALTAHRAGLALPADVRFERGDPPTTSRYLHGYAFNEYVETIRRELQRSLDSPEIRINRVAAPSEIWVRMRDDSSEWMVLSWRLAGPKAPLAAVGLLAAAALIVLSGAALSARRLTAPLAGLAAAAARLAEGERVDVRTDSGPSEVRSLAVAFQSMSDRLEALDEQRELMLGGISHDLRTPLTRIKVALELLDSPDPALRAEIDASVEEMDRMIGQFLHYARANYREKPSSVVLDDAVRQCLQPYASDERVTLALEHARVRCQIAVESLRHILLNLVQNALEYGHGRVTVGAAMKDDEIRLEVNDAGEGVSDADWLLAVRPFQRLGSAPSSGHSGLGLALVERLVSNGGGRLSCRRGVGFSVIVQLPSRGESFAA